MYPVTGEAEAGELYTEASLGCSQFKVSLSNLMRFLSQDTDSKRPEAVVQQLSACTESVLRCGSLNPACNNQQHLSPPPPQHLIPQCSTFQAVCEPCLRLHRPPPTSSIVPQRLANYLELSLFSFLLHITFLVGGTML